MTNRGKAKVIPDLADPAAGAEVSVTVPSGVWWIPLAIELVLVTSATAANRSPSLVFDDGTTAFARIPPSDFQVANETVTYSWVRGVRGEITSSVVTPYAFAMPLPRVSLAAGFRIRTVTTNLQAGDNFRVPGLYVVEYKGVPFVDPTLLRRAG